MVWIGFDFDFEDFDFEVFLETEDEEVLVFFDFGVLEGEGLFAVVFFGFGLRAEEKEGWMVVMGVAFTMRGEGLGVSVDFMGEAELGD
jgi:hypothetical protein